MVNHIDPDDLKGLEIVVPAEGDLAALQSAPEWEPFNPNVLGFVKDLSRTLMKNPAARSFPEIISLAHWMRPKALLDLAQEYASQQPPMSVRMSRGVALHFAPGNVDTIFLYSTLLSILMGNRNIVRISARKSPQIELLTEVLTKLLDQPEHKDLRTRVMIVRYDHDAKITKALSNMCDVRIVWGGDKTVNEIRALPLPPRSRDVSFPNRWSLAVIDAQHFTQLKTEDVSKLASNFVNDAYWFGQMACSSPRLVIWRGDEQLISQASQKFWNSVGNEAKKFADDIAPVNFVNKLVSQNIAAIEKQITSIKTLPDNTVSVISLPKVTVPSNELFVGEGLFWEAAIQHLDEIAPVLNTQSQTLISSGIEAAEWAALIAQNGLQIDRIVPFGQALQFGHIWDGLNLLDEFSRLVKIEV